MHPNFERLEVAADKWVICKECDGTGKRKRLIKKVAKKLHHSQIALSDVTEKTPPTFHLENCETCEGKGLLPSTNFPEINTQYPHVAIIGGGIGGIALAVACLHRGIPFTIYERDTSFNARSQGYGLTLQQASKAMAGLGILSLQAGVVSTKHIVHTPSGKIVGEWGMRKWLETNPNAVPRKNNIHNIHIARQELRLALLHQLGGHKKLQWGHQLTSIKTSTQNQLELSFVVNSKEKKTTADLVVGADGIRSMVRNLIIGDDKTPLRYLGCIVILGICKLDLLTDVESNLLDSATVFQTANGKERLYVMPFTADSVMWQLSFPMNEDDAKLLSSKGPDALKEKAIEVTQWHAPIPQIMRVTPAANISGYPVYDRELLHADLMQQAGSITLIGDAAHPMSPFKGQGANQALLDALSLARAITKGCKDKDTWQQQGLRKVILTDFETEMMERSAVKVKDSRAAAAFLHTDVVLQEGNITRGGFARKMGQQPE